MATEHRPLELFPDEPPEPAYETILRYPRENAGDPPVLRSIWIERLKGFRKLEMEFDSFNVLVGANNSGKSTVLQAIDLAFRLIQYQAEFRQGRLVLPTSGRRLPDELLPVAEAVDFWYLGQTRERNARLPVRLGLSVRMGEEELDFEFEIKRLWGGTNSRLVKVTEGTAQALVESLIARRPVLIPASVGLVTREEWRTPARLETLSMTGRHNETVRNLLLTLQNDVGAAAILSKILQIHFGADIEVREFHLDTDQFISVLYRSGEFAHDIFSAGAGFQQIVQLLSYLLLLNPGIALLDEPDAHLNCSLQRIIVDILREFTDRGLAQAILATHSKEIINYVSPSDVIPVSVRDACPRRLEQHDSVIPILQDLGSVDNADLAAMVASRRCLFVEGREDKHLLARFAAKVGSTVFEGLSQVVVIVAEGVDNPERYVGLDVLESFLDGPVRALIVRDRDCLPDDLLREVTEYAADNKRPVFVLRRTHIENYLIDATLIHRTLCARAEKGRIESPGEKSVAGLIDDVLEELREATFDRAGKEVDKHHSVYHGKHLDHMTVNRLARAFVDEKWQDRESRRDVVIGKTALRMIRRRCQEEWGITFSNTMLVEQMTAAEVPAEIKELITLIEAL